MDRLAPDDRRRVKMLDGLLMLLRREAGLETRTLMRQKSTKPSALQWWLL